MNKENYALKLVDEIIPNIACTWDTEVTQVLGKFHLCVPNRHAQWKHGIRDFVKVTSDSLTTVCYSRHG